MNEKAHSTPLEQWISAWLQHQRALGRSYDHTEWILKQLRNFLVTTNNADLDQASFDLWCQSLSNLSATTRRGRQLIVCKFCRYRQRTEPDCFVPDPLHFARMLPYRRPVILEPEQVAQLLVAAGRLVATSNSPLLPEVMRMAVILLYTAGLRRGELVRLTLGDVDAKTGLLRVRSSKFHKSRLVPLSLDASDAVRVYLRQRLATPFDSAACAPLLCCGACGHHGYSGTGLGQAINRLFVAADVKDSEGRRPRVHDIRHSFAVQALIRWYRDGADVQSNLPRLAMFMGHVSIVSTAHYLHFVPTIRELASERFEASFGAVVSETTP